MHRALDTVGAAIGPLLAFLVLWAVPGRLLVGLRGLERGGASSGSRCSSSSSPTSGRGATRGGGATGRAASLAARARVTPDAPGRRGQRGLLGVLTVSDGFLYLSLQQRDDFAAAWFPLLFVGTNTAYFLLAVPFGRLADRVGRQKVLVGGHVFLVGAYLAAAGPAAGHRRDGGGARCCSERSTPRPTGCCPPSPPASSTPRPGPSASRPSQTVVSLARFALLPRLRPAVDHRPDARVPSSASPCALALAVPVAWWLLRDVAPRPPGWPHERARPGRRARARPRRCSWAAGRWRSSSSQRGTRRRRGPQRERPADDRRLVPSPPGRTSSSATPRSAADLGRVALSPSTTPAAPGRIDRPRLRPGLRRRRSHPLPRPPRPGSSRGTRPRSTTTPPGARTDLPLTGSPSRARLSRDGRLAATTSFVAGDSYAATTFSTRTVVTDLDAGQSTDLETFTVVDGGRTVKPVDRNFWGVTFGSDDDRFFVTVAYGGQTHLAEGRLSTRTVTTMRTDAECPSLSPDQTRVAYKKRGDRARGDWRIAVLDLASGRETELAETRSVDDQVEWLDDGRVIYGLPGEGSEAAQTNVWVVAADGTGTPSMLIPNAWSPAVVR